MELIELTLLKDNKHLGKEGRVFSADKPQADYLIKVGIAAIKGDKSQQKKRVELPKEEENTNPEVDIQETPAPEVKKETKPKKKTKKK